MPRSRSSNLEMSVADSQGGIGHILGQALLNELAASRPPDRVACVLTHVVVDPTDPAFAQPDQADRPVLHRRGGRPRRPSGTAGRWSRTPGAATGGSSPRPSRSGSSRRAQIRALVDAGFVVIAVGGGGIAVVETAPGQYRGVEAVIDKDRASALLAASLDIPLLVLSTGVERVAVHFRQPDERWLDRMTVGEAARLPGRRRVPQGLAWAPRSRRRSASSSAAARRS